MRTAVRLRLRRGLAAQCMAGGSQPVVGCNADAAALKEAGNVAFSSGKHLQAYELFSEAILKDPSSALLRSNRAGALASLGRHEEAFADAELCCKLQPDWWKGYTRRGHALFHLKRYPESEQSFLEALRLNPGEKTVVEALEKTRASMRGEASTGGPRVAAASSSAAPPPVFVPPPGSVPYSQQPGYTAPGPASSASSGPTVDFQKLSSEELRKKLEQAAANLSDEQLDTELRLAGISVPPGASRADKVKLYTQTPEDKKGTAKKRKGMGFKCPGRKVEKKSDGEKLLELRKKWLDEWNTWDDARLVKRLAKLGIDGEGLSRAQLLDELLQVQTERYSNRCHPERVQKYGLALVGGATFLTFAGAVIGFLVSGS